MLSLTSFSAQSRRRMRRAIPLIKKTSTSSILASEVVSEEVSAGWLDEAKAA
jgi:hypothetical protein